MATALFRFDDSYSRLVPGLSVPWTAAPVDAPELLVLNGELAAELGDMGPFHHLLDAVRRPYDQRPGLEHYTGPAPPGTAPHTTYCGT